RRSAMRSSAVGRASRQKAFCPICQHAICSAARFARSACACVAASSGPRLCSESCLAGPSHTKWPSGRENGASSSLMPNPVATGKTRLSGRSSLRRTRARDTAGLWPERIWETSAAFTGLIVGQPHLCHAVFVEPYAADVQRPDDFVVGFTLFLEEGYRYRTEAARVPRIAGEAIGGVVLEVIN